MAAETTVANGPVRLTTTDLGGHGPDLVLMHGLGLTRSSMAAVADLLTGWRVVTLDLRGHGASTTGTWDFPAAVSDLQAVIDAHGLEKPFLAGHSLGGLVALRYALSGRPVSGVVNIDGWGPGVAERYRGEETAAVSAYLARVARGALPSPATALVTRRTRQWREGTTRQVLRELHGADAVAWHRDAPCPSLAVLATARTGRAERWLLGATAARRQDAHRTGLREDLSALAEERADVHLTEVEAGHLLIRSHPGAVAAAMSRFRDATLAGAGEARSPGLFSKTP